MSVRAELVDFADEAPRGGGTRSYAELCKAMETATPSTTTNQPTGAPFVAFVPFEPKHAPVKPAERTSTVSGIFDGMALNAAEPTATKKADTPKSPESTGPQKTIERPKPSAGAAAVDAEAKRLLDEKTVADYEAVAEVIDAKVVAIADDQKQRKNEKVTAKKIKDEYAELGKLRERAESWEAKLALAEASKQSDRLSAQRAKIKELIDANRLEAAELEAATQAKQAKSEEAAAAKAAAKERLEQKAKEQGKSVEEVKADEAAAAKAAKAKPARPKKKTPQELTQDEYDAYVAAERAAGAGAMAMTLEDFTAKKKQKQQAEAAAKAQLTKAYKKYVEESGSVEPRMSMEEYDAFLKRQKAEEARAAGAEATRRANLTEAERAQEDAEIAAAKAAKGQLTRAYNKYVAERKAMGPTARIMTIEQYEEVQKEQKQKEEAEAQAEATRRENLTQEQRDEEDADNVRMANAARTANAAAAKAYKKYVQEMTGEDAPDPKSKEEWGPFVAKAVEDKKVLPEAKWIAIFKDKKARDAHVELMQETLKDARKGEEQFKPAEFFQGLIDTLAYSRTSEQKRMAAMTGAERAAIDDYANIVKNFEEDTAKLLEKLELYKSFAEEAEKEKAEVEAKTKAAAVAAAAKEAEAAEEEEKEQWKRNLRKPYEDAMMGMYELRWNLLSDMKEEAQQYLDKLNVDPVVDPEDPNYDARAVNALMADRKAVLADQGWVQNMVTCLTEVAKFPCLKPDQTVDPITKKAYASFAEEFDATKKKDAEYNDYAAKAGANALEYEDYFDAKAGYQDYRATLMSDQAPMSEAAYLKAREREVAEEEEGEEAEDDSDDGGEEAGEEQDVEMDDSGMTDDKYDSDELDDSRGTLVQFSVSGLAEPYTPDPSLSEDAQRAAETKAKNAALSKAKSFVGSTLEPKLSAYMRGLSYLFAPKLAESQISKHLDMANGAWFRIDPNATPEEADNQVRELARKTFPPKVSEDPNYIWLRNVPFPNPMEVDVLDEQTGLPTGATKTIGIGIFSDLDAFEKIWNANGMVNIRVPVEPITEAEWPDGTSEELSRTPVPMTMRYVPEATNFGASASSNLTLTERTVPISSQFDDDMRTEIVKQAIMQAMTDDAISVLMVEYLRSVPIGEWQVAIDPRVAAFEVEPELEPTAQEREWLRSFAPAKMNQWDTALRYNQKRSLLTRVGYELDKQTKEQKFREGQGKAAAIDLANAKRNTELSKTKEGAEAVKKEQEEEIKNQYEAYVAEEKRDGGTPIPFESFRLGQLS